MNTNLDPKAIFYIVIQTAMIIVVLSLMSSCKTIGTVHEQINYRDSTVINYRDSTVIHFRDSVNIITQHIKVNDSTSLVIQFGQGGGTYNAKTGEATNVTNVQQTDTHHEQRDSTAFYRSQYEYAVHVSDSLSEQITNYQYQLDEERKKARSGYDKFCSCWFWVTFILLLAVIAFYICDKIPATKPYTTAIKMFFKIV